MNDQIFLMTSSSSGFSISKLPASSAFAIRHRTLLAKSSTDPTPQSHLFQLVRNVPATDKLTTAPCVAAGNQLLADFGHRERVAQTCSTGLRLFLLKEPRTYKSGPRYLLKHA